MTDPYLSESLRDLSFRLGPQVESIRFQGGTNEQILDTLRMGLIRTGVLTKDQALVAFNLIAAFAPKSARIVDEAGPPYRILSADKEGINVRYTYEQAHRAGIEV